MTTIAEFTAKERERRERYAADRYRWRRDLARDDHKIKRCGTCGGWRYFGAKHGCLRRLR